MDAFTLVVIFTKLYAIEVHNIFLVKLIQYKIENLSLRTFYLEEDGFLSICFYFFWGGVWGGLKTKCQKRIICL
jgi:hypothetical protein